MTPRWYASTNEIPCAGWYLVRYRVVGRNTGQFAYWKYADFIELEPGQEISPQPALRADLVYAYGPIPPIKTALQRPEATTTRAEMLEEDPT